MHTTKKRTKVSVQTSKQNLDVAHDLHLMQIKKYQRNTKLFLKLTKKDEMIIKQINKKKD